MGNCGSAKVARTEQSNANVTDKYSSKADILYEIMVTIYTNGNTFEAVRLILDDSVARNSFRKYLKSEYAAEGLLYYEEVELFKNADGSNLLTGAKSICDNYLQPGSSNEVNISDAMKSKILGLLTNTTQVVQDKAAIVQELILSQREVMAILAMNGFPRYVDSPAFKTWITDELQIAKTLSPSNLKQATATFASAAYSSMDPSEFELLGGNSSWLKQFVALAELLPVSVAIATARQERRGYPLIYVNPEFTILTGYGRQEVIGKSCKILQQPAKSERDSINQFVRALSSNVQARIDITNFKKDGTFFRNLVCLKPVLAQSGQCAYVIALQVDITGEGLSQKMIKFADTILNLLPNSFRSD